MTAILTHNVKLYDGFPPGTGTITIGDDNSFTLTKIDPATNQSISTIISSPMSAIVVRGQGTALRFRVGNVTKRVDFSLTSELVRGLGGIGDVAGGVLAIKSGVKDVVNALRKGGAQVHYLGYWQRILLIWGIVIVFFVVVFGSIAIAALGQH